MRFVKALNLESKIDFKIQFHNSSRLIVYANIFWKSQSHENVIKWLIFLSSQLALCAICFFWEWWPAPSSDRHRKWRWKRICANDTAPEKIRAERELRHGKRKRADDGLTYAIRLEFGEHKPPRSVWAHPQLWNISRIIS